MKKRVLAMVRKPNKLRGWRLAVMLVLAPVVLPISLIAALLVFVPASIVYISWFTAYWLRWKILVVPTPQQRCSPAVAFANTHGDVFGGRQCINKGEFVIETPGIVQTSAQLTAVIHLTVPRAEIRKVMGPGIGEVRAAIAAQGIAAVGPWFTHHLRVPSEVFDFEVGVPVGVAVAAVGRVRPGELRAARVVRTVYCGPYEGLAGAWREFEGWIVAGGYKSGADLWECYVVGPESGADSSKWRTELNRPLSDGR